MLSERLNFCRLDCSNVRNLRDLNLDILQSYYTLLDDSEETDTHDGVSLFYKNQSCALCSDECKSCFGPGPGDCETCGDG